MKNSKDDSSDFLCTFKIYSIMLEISVFDEQLPTLSSESCSQNEWNQSEEDFLLSITGTKNLKVKDIHKYFPSRSTDEIQIKWEEIIQNNKWTSDEDFVIKSFVKENGTNNWSKLQKLLPTRTQKQIRERWHNYLQPIKSHFPWTPEEDQLLINLHKIYGNSWIKISSFIPGRSDQSCKNRWSNELKQTVHIATTKESPNNHTNSKGNQKGNPKGCNDKKDQKNNEKCVISHQKYTENVIQNILQIDSPFKKSPRSFFNAWPNEAIEKLEDRVSFNKEGLIHFQDPLKYSLDHFD
ncbi:hypothetical protein TRFO_07099 [Tritrichomonas foetus]|uniref:Myb-like DNA-binding domain containing protein n=1 Tax=Tritrichomonas foetus TaxID=1144522 RepID=A0A1J4JXP1_9EUKA|nr:hypothetical protein TRFO_07099 [Tritrichomonas foetus]|eukprot:OHT02300.1 hypothetical protein TRFO_07099 [Tritrichomonas foetus]